MKKYFLLLPAVVLLINSVLPGPVRPDAKGKNSFSQERIRISIEYLASDGLGGRAPGSKGERLVTAYLTEQYRKMGLKPGNPNGTYLQEVPLIGAKLKNEPILRLDGKGNSLTLKYSEEFVAWTPRKDEVVKVTNSELVFVGYGIVAPEYGWDDYKKVDVRDKILIMLVGDPPLPDSTLFGGKAMTYYGRWTYKYEIAAKKGASGAIIVHNTDAAGYPWEVVANSWSGEQFDIIQPERDLSRCAMEAWITEEVAENLFTLCGLSLQEAKEACLSTKFEPISLEMGASITFESKFRDVISQNVVAVVKGSNQEHKDEYIIYTSHWDHLGYGKPLGNDSIYNGALDNASGVAGVLEIARMFAANAGKLKRSVLFINTTAEESGLLGSYHYTSNPLYPLDKTVAVINIDGLNIWGRTKDMIVVGKGFSTLDDYLQKAVAAQKRFLRSDSEPEKGFYFRSDHFPFAKRGVPALYAGTGIEFIGRPKEWGKNIRKKYTREKYHKPLDEFDPSWNLAGALEDLEALFEVGFALAGNDDFPLWTEKSSFKKIREQMMKSGR